MHQLHLGPAAAACGRSELALLVSACLTIGEVNMVNDDNEGQYDHDDHNHHEDHGP